MWMRLVLIYIWHVDLKGFVEDKRCQRIRPTQRGRNLSLVDAVGCEGVIAHNITFGDYNTYKFLEFIQTMAISSLSRQRFILMDKCPIWKISWITTSFWKCWTHLLPCAIIYNGPILNDTEWVFGHIKSHVWRNDLQNHRTLLGHINNDVQVIIADMMVG
jgi:hypothetical protein